MSLFTDHYAHCTAAEAKKEYFLTTKDLVGVPYESDSLGFGMGRPVKWYSFDNLEAVAIAKHGAAGLAKKRAAREKRQQTQKLKETAAQQAKEAQAKTARLLAREQARADKLMGQLGSPVVEILK